MCGGSKRQTKKRCCVPETERLWYERSIPPVPPPPPPRNVSQVHAQSLSHRAIQHYTLEGCSSTCCLSVVTHHTPALFVACPPAGYMLLFCLVFSHHGMLTVPVTVVPVCPWFEAPPVSVQVPVLPVAILSLLSRPRTQQKESSLAEGRLGEAGGWKGELLNGRRNYSCLSSAHVCSPLLRACCLSSHRALPVCSHVHEQPMSQAHTCMRRRFWVNAVATRSFRKRQMFSATTQELRRLFRSQLITGRTALEGRWFRQRVCAGAPATARVQTLCCHAPTT